MRICWGSLFKMLRFTSRLNVALVIICLGAVVFMWNRCQVGQLDNRWVAKVEPSTGEYRHLDTDVAVEDKGKIDEQEQPEETDLDSKSDEETDTETDPPTKDKPIYKNIEVLVNDETKIKGRVENKEVFIPFTFIKDHFEMEGQVVRDEFGEKFHIHHTNYKYFTPKTATYDPHGSFLWFVGYNVEMRSRVKCITGVDEVPISTQWGPEGYRYPIQIAQYGLSHFSMLVDQPQGDIKVVDDCEKPGNQEWAVTGKGAYVRSVFNEDRKSQVMEFGTSDSRKSSVSLPLLSSSKTYVLSLDILFKRQGQLSINVEVGDTKTFTLIYDTSKTLMNKGKQSVTYGIGPTTDWRRVTRNLLVDLNKAFGEKGRKRNTAKRTKLHISEIQSLNLQGKGYIDNVTLMENNHKAAFLASARWLLKNQDKKGGWPIPVKRKIKNGAELKPGWYSAMAQGQAMSVLTRAYHVTKDLEYLEAAKRATGLFRVESKDNGILAIYMKKYKWYEEYPFTPSIFVLNGFLYSLMGLYDLKMSLPSEERSEAEMLFQDGMTSLRAMILMYDTGSGTIYDLRHLTMDSEPNLARWDYHATHVNQVTWLTMIHPSSFYKGVLKRWQGYFKGIRAAHN